MRQRRLTNEFMASDRLSCLQLKPAFPAAPYFIFGSLALLSAAGDVRMLAPRGVSGTKPIVRHLWRVSFAFLIAAFSFFLGQQKVMPAYIRGSKLLFVPPLLILIMLIYWLCRIRQSDSKFPAKKFEKVIGGPATWRNMNTVVRLAGRYSH